MPCYQKVAPLSDDIEQVFVDKVIIRLGLAREDLIQDILTQSLSKSKR
jgi:hypothetical protein